MNSSEIPAATQPFRIWVDADAVPGAVKDVVLAAALKRRIETVFVANKPISLPQSPLLSLVIVKKTPDAADYYINEQAAEGDFTITQDIPLAHLLVKRGLTVINPRGEKYSEENIGERLSIRNLMEQLRDQGEITGGPARFGEKEKRAFAATFDRELTRLLKRSLD
ncbi:MAG TPA: YaiI/YqxD family protein [Oculatellaceae cyanobacterium]